MRAFGGLTTVLVIAAHLPTDTHGERCSVFSEGTNIIQECNWGCCDQKCCDDTPTSAIIGAIVGSALLVLLLVLLVICCTRARCRHRRCCHGDVADASDDTERGTDNHPPPGPLLVTNPPRFAWNVPKKYKRKDTTKTNSTHRQNSDVPQREAPRKTAFSIWKW